MDIEDGYSGGFKTVEMHVATYEAQKAYARLASNLRSVVSLAEELVEIGLVTELCFIDGHKEFKNRLPHLLGQVDTVISFR